MLFNSFIFLLVFLPIAYIVFWRLGTAHSRYIWLALTGYVFYGYWDPRFCLLMAFSTLVAYTAGRVLLNATTERERTLALIVPVAVDLMLLGFFKYANFLLSSGKAAFAALGVDVQVPSFDVVLPVGISFYTFHTITYIVDAYRGAIKPTRNLFEFSAYVSLFSQLVAGPIVRFRQIEADLENLGHAVRRAWLIPGVSLFVYGLFEKVVIADTLAAFVDPALAVHSDLSSAGAWLAMLGYSFQLYFDFCGYSDMAVGLGLMFGLRIPWNFDSPYKALDPSDFWRRWHISLSTCMRDYLYIALGGNRNGELATYRNLLLTMLIGGLWHGANWTFVVWGGYHGMLLVAYRLLRSPWDRLPAVVRRFVMFVLVVAGWVFFRSTDFAMSGDLLVKMFWPSEGALPKGAFGMTITVAIAMLWAMRGPNARELHCRSEYTALPLFLIAAAAGAALAMMLGGGESPFLYFQF